MSNRPVDHHIEVRSPTHQKTQVSGGPPEYAYGAFTRYVSVTNARYSAVERLPLQKPKPNSLGLVLCMMPRW